MRLVLFHRYIIFCRENNWTPSWAGLNKFILKRVMEKRDTDVWCKMGKSNGGHVWK